MSQELANTTAVNGDAALRVMNRGGTLQQVRTNYTTAISVQQPRSLGDVERRVLEEASFGGEDWYYGWGSGKDIIEGPSVKLANAVARCWGNCAVDMGNVQDLADSWIFTAVFIDLETGFTLSRQFRMSKNFTVYGKHDAARKEEIRFSVGQSKATRNVILNALPSWLIDKAMNQAKAGVRQAIDTFVKQKGIVFAVDMMLRELKKLGIEEADVLKRLEIADKKAIDVDCLVRLKGDKAAIESGHERAEDLFPIAKPQEKGKEEMSKLKGEMTGQPKQEQKQEPAKEEAKGRGKKKDEPKKTEQPPAAEGEIPNEEEMSRLDQATEDWRDPGDNPAR